MRLARFFDAPAGIVFGVALAVRLFFMAAFGMPGPVSEEAAEWTWGWEQAAVAHALLRGEGLADPFGRGTGPTAWCGAVYPTILAGIIGCFGATGQAVSSCTAIVNSLFSAGTAVALSRLGQGLGRARLGRIAAWTWAFHPAAVYFPLTYVWDTAILAFGITYFLAALVRVHPGVPLEILGQPVRLGMGLGLLTLLNASALALVPVALACWRPSGSSSLAATCRAWTAFGVGMLVVLSPWLARNHILLGTIQPKANLGVELMVGNHDDADGGFRPHLHPRYNLQEFAAYRELGEVAYDKRCRGIFWKWLRENPRAFARLTALRAKTFWLGFSPFEPFPLRSGESRARDWQGWIKWLVYFLDGVLALLGVTFCFDRHVGRIAIGGALLCFPLVYYFAHVMERYRFPIEPLLVYSGVAFVLALPGLGASRRATT